MDRCLFLGFFFYLFSSSSRQSHYRRQLNNKYPMASVNDRPMADNFRKIIIYLPKHMNKVISRRKLFCDEWSSPFDPITTIRQRKPGDPRGTMAHRFEMSLLLDARKTAVAWVLFILECFWKSDKCKIKFSPACLWCALLLAPTDSFTTQTDHCATDRLNGQVGRLSSDGDGRPTIVICATKKTWPRRVGISSQFIGP